MAERTITVQLPDDIPGVNLRAVLQGDVPAAILSEWEQLLRPHLATGAALASLHMKNALRYPFLGDLDAVGVVSTEPGVEFLENGRAGFHLPQHWGRRGGKWKGQTEDGVRYATVRLPVLTGPSEGASSTARRLGTSMPSQVYEGADARYWGGAANVPAPSAALDLDHYPDAMEGLGDFFKQAKSYDYYRQLFGDEANELPVDEFGNPVHHYEWKASPYERLMRGSKQENPESGAKSSEYFVLRTITEDSPGWWIPPTPAHHFSELATDQAWPTIERIVDAAIAADMEAALGSALEGLTQ